MGEPIVIHQFTPCLELQALCRFTGTPYVLNNARFPHAVSTGYLPQLQHGGELKGGDAAAAYLEERVCGAALTAPLTPLQAAHAAGLVALVRGALAHVERWCHFGGDGGYARNRAALAAHAHAPLGWLLARQLKMQCVGARFLACARARTQAHTPSHAPTHTHTNKHAATKRRSCAAACAGRRG